VIKVLRAETRKLRRPTLALPTLFAAMGLTALTTSLLYLLIDSPSGNGREGVRVSAEQLSLSDGVVYSFQSAATLLGVIALCVFAAQTAQEYTYGTLRNLLLREPSRMRILLGKYVAMSIFAFVIVMASAVVSIGLSFALAADAKVSTALWTSSHGKLAIAHALGNALLSTIGFGTLGMILGLILRSPITAISIGVIWLLIVENLLSAVVKNADKWLPGMQLSAVATGGSLNNSYSRALTIALLYILIGSVTAAGLFKRRDVTN
jgi:ABC-type transport system involved in multi-copper enzyme maturation permease subunit